MHKNYVQLIIYFVRQQQIPQIMDSMQFSFQIKIISMSDLMQPNRIHMHLLLQLIYCHFKFHSKKEQPFRCRTGKNFIAPKCQKTISLIYIIEEQLWNGQTGKLYSTAELMMSKQMSQPSITNSPQFTILHGKRGLSDLLVSWASSFRTTSIPSTMCPNTTWRLSNHGVYMMHINKIKSRRI